MLIVIPSRVLVANVIKYMKSASGKKFKHKI